MVTRAERRRQEREAAKVKRPEEICTCCWGKLPEMVKEFMSDHAGHDISLFGTGWSVAFECIDCDPEVDQADHENV